MFKKDNASAGFPFEIKVYILRAFSSGTVRKEMVEKYILFFLFNTHSCPHPGEKILY